MCTITILPLQFAADERRGFRVAVNRDESWSRPAAHPPEIRWFGDRRAALPTDPVGGGTWVAVNDAGVVLALLNGSEPAGYSRHIKASRGLIIPALLGHGSAASAAAALADVDTEDFRPFRLVMADRERVVEARWDRSQVKVGEMVALTGPLLFTSSSLGDALVEEPRRRLFEELVGAGQADDPPIERVARQQAFHRHRWPDRPHLSVSMRRAEAHTVSFTVVEVRDDRADLTYYPDAPDVASRPFPVSLKLDVRVSP